MHNGLWLNLKRVTGRLHHTIKGSLCRRQPSNSARHSPRCQPLSCVPARRPRAPSGLPRFPGSVRFSYTTDSNAHATPGARETPPKPPAQAQERHGRLCAGTAADSPGLTVQALLLRHRRGQPRGFFSGTAAGSPWTSCDGAGNGALGLSSPLAAGVSLSGAVRSEGA